MALKESGAAEVILEKDCTAEALMEKIRQMLENTENYQKMHEALLTMSVPDSAERICGIMEELISRKTKK